MINRLGKYITLFALVLTASAYAQLSPQKVSIEFSFTAGGKMMPAGQYELIHPTESTPWVTLRNLKENASVQVKVLTLLSRTPDKPRTKLVFDKVGGKNYLQEIWLPEQEGLLVRSKKSKTQESVAVAE